MLNKIIISGPMVFSKNEKLSEGYVKINRGFVDEMGQYYMENLGEKDFHLMEFPSDYFVVPGTIYTGAENVLFGALTPEKISHTAKKYGKVGITSYLLNVAYDEKNEKQNFENLSIARDYIIEEQYAHEAEILGVRLFANNEINGLKKIQEEAKGCVKAITVPPSEISKEMIESAALNDVKVTTEESMCEMFEMYQSLLLNGLTTLHEPYPYELFQGNLDILVEDSEKWVTSESKLHEKIGDLIAINVKQPMKKFTFSEYKGSLMPKKEADIVILNADMEVVKTFARGVLTYSK